MVTIVPTQYKRIVWLSALIALLTFITLKPDKFIDLWLTKDQQGLLLFNAENYEKASKTFNNVSWRAFSSYGNENYKDAEIFYSQFNDKENLLAQANALAHGRNYLKARDLYQSILNQYPTFIAAKHNRDIVQAIID
jgi:Ca-activated chloride channel family protein